MKDEIATIGAMIDLGEKDKKKLYKQLERDFVEKNHAEVPFLITTKELNNAADSFFKFLSLPQETKGKYYQVPTDNPRDSGVGYVRKFKKTGEYDNKEYFHYHPAIEDKYFAALLENEEHRETVETFFINARNIFTEAEDTLSKLTEALETEFPHIRKKMFPLSEKWGSVLRFLKYDVEGRGKFLAAGHYDMGACTLALAESTSGLRMGANNETLKPVVRKEDTVIFFPCLNFPPITDSRFTPGWHDVVQSTDETFNDETARWAIVFFVGAIGLPIPSLDATHTPQ